MVEVRGVSLHAPMRGWRMLLALVAALAVSAFAAPSASALVFAPKADYAVIDKPRAIAAAELNGSGGEELISSNQATPGRVSMFPGAGTGAFGSRTDLSTGLGGFRIPYGVRVADVDGNAAPDIITANLAHNSVSVLLNNGTGTLAEGVPYAATGPFDVEVADLNGDGDLDLATANPNADTVSVLLGNGDGTFAAKTDFTAGDGAKRIAVADLDGDGAPDLATANENASTASVLIGNGDGTFDPKVDYATAQTPAAITTADFNGDSEADLVTSNLGTGGSISMLLGNGDGTFDPRTDTPASRLGYSLAAGDIDGDSNADVVQTGAADDVVSVLLGNGDGTLDAKQDFGVGDFPSGVVIADFDNDGAADLATSNEESDNLSVLLQMVPQILTANTVGEGSDAGAALGTLTSSPAGIDCRREGAPPPSDDQGTCSADFGRDSTVQLTATPSNNRTTAQISGVCAAGPGRPGQAVSCTGLMNADKSVIATFARPPDCDSATPTIRGTGKITGTPGDDVIVGSGAKDKIDGGGGNDLICGLGEADKIKGGDGDDIVIGGDGKDSLDGGAGNDALHGELGENKLKGGDGDDSLYGGPDDEKIDGGDGVDGCSGGGGIDKLKNCP